MDNKRLGKALDIMRLAEEAAARSGGISLVQIVETFGVNLRTAQRMSRALEVAFPTVQTYTDKERRKWWQLSDHRLLHMQGIRDSELSALEMGIRRADLDGATTEVSALTSLRNRLLATMPPSLARRAEVDAEAVLEARGHACRPGPRAVYAPHVLGVIDNALKGPFAMETLASRPDLAPAVGFDDCLAWACRITQGFESPGAAAAEPALRRMADGLAHRARALRLLGNGVHPLAAAHAWRSLASAHSLGPVDLAADGPGPAPGADGFP